MKHYFLSTVEALVCIFDFYLFLYTFNVWTFLCKYVCIPHASVLLLSEIRSGHRDPLQPLVASVLHPPKTELDYKSKLGPTLSHLPLCCLQRLEESSDSLKLYSYA